MKDGLSLRCAMGLVRLLLCFLFGKHEPDERGYCRHCNFKARDDK